MDVLRDMLTGHAVAFALSVGVGDHAGPDGNVALVFLRSDDPPETEFMDAVREGVDADVERVRPCVCVPVSAKGREAFLQCGSQPGPVCRGVTSSLRR
jgi:hypothetical protein